MHKTTEILALVTLVGAGVLVTGCGPVATGRDDGAFEPSREERVEGIAEQMCDRIEECGNIGEGGGLRELQRVHLRQRGRFL